MAAETATPAAPRLGPRPLALHLAAAATTWLGSNAALPMLRSGWLPWRPELGEAPRELVESLGRADPDRLVAALEGEVRRRLDLFHKGLVAYRHHPYRRDLPPAAEAWREGTTRLLDYGPFKPAAKGRGGKAARTAPILAVPSLINRAYILDLSSRCSLMRWLAGRGFHAYLVDWSAPGEVERGFTLTDYIAGRLERALEATVTRAGRPAVLVGYCMGGLLTLALARRRPDLVAGLVLLATPWDFHAERAELNRCLVAATAPVLAAAERTGEFPVDALQALFMSLDPLLAARKFIAFAGLDPASSAARSFVALEDWLNDGVPLAAPVARECLEGWYGANTTGRGLWRVAGDAVRPEDLAVPTLVVVPERDRIVPPASAAPLGVRIPGAEVLGGATGHIGMIAGGRARKTVWQPLAAWIEGLGRS